MTLPSFLFEEGLKGAVLQARDGERRRLADGRLVPPAISKTGSGRSQDEVRFGEGRAPAHHRGDALFDHWRSIHGRPSIDLPTFER